jgi:hypothetical protein
LRALLRKPRLDGSTGFTPDEIAQVRQHVFFDEHPSTRTTAARRRCAGSIPTPTWPKHGYGSDRGNAQPSGIALLDHELAESRYLQSNSGATYRDAHQAANLVSNWEGQVPPS